MTVDLPLWIGLILVISYSVILKKIKSETASEVSYVLFIIWFNILTILLFRCTTLTHFNAVPNRECTPSFWWSFSSWYLCCDLDCALKILVRLQVGELQFLSIVHHFLPEMSDTDADHQIVVCRLLHGLHNWFNYNWAGPNRYTLYLPQCILCIYHSVYLVGPGLKR